MQFVNLTDRVVVTSFSGMLGPGRISADGGQKRRRLEEAMSEIVKACGNTLGIRLNKKECELLDKLMKLDEAGGGFDPESIPSEIRNDPTGAKRAEEAQRAAQQKAINDMQAANDAKAKREALINGEVDENPRKPVGPATMQGEKVEPSMLKSGFEAIMEENARIAKGEKPKQIDPNEVLDPIGAHAKKDEQQEAAPAEQQQEAPAPADAAPIKNAENRPDDAVRAADAKLPLPQVNERAGAMDRSAAEVARKLSIVGPDTEANAEKPAKSKGKGKKAK